VSGANPGKKISEITEIKLRGQEIDEIEDLSSLAQLKKVDLR
jgi:hypothetical protein